MQHRCLRCGAVYADDDESILRGCDCGSVFFLLMTDGKDVQEIQEMEKELKKKKTSLEKELMKQIEEKKVEEVKMEKEVETPGVKKIKPRRRRKKAKFGVETIRIPRPGVYEINIDALMKKRPIIILEKGKIYIIHLPSVFEKIEK
jgi:predicted  nucleic acid-binding Zn-ribbon protein